MPTHHLSEIIEILMAGFLIGVFVTVAGLAIYLNYEEDRDDEAGARMSGPKK